MKKHRLTSADFRVFRPVRRVSGDFFTLSVAPAPSGTKWACVVSKKVAQKAVTRNLVKRRCRALARSMLAAHHEKVALVFHAKKGAPQATFAELKKDVAALLSKAGLRGTMRTT